MFSLQSISLYRGGRCLFDEATVAINPGDKVGLTGANGSGKSSLLLMLMGKLSADNGDIKLPGKPQISWAEQETLASKNSAISFVLDGDKELRIWEQKLTEAQASDSPKLISTATDKLDHLQAWSASNRAGKLLAGLGFSESQQQQSVASFSGGWQMRLNLARALMCPSDILLLDEPTNHLDLDAIIWLERWLRSYTGTLMVISHDRDFLDNVVLRILHIEHASLSSWKGNYSDFEKLQAEKLQLDQKNLTRANTERKRLQSFIDRFRAKATKAKQVQSRVKAMEKLGNASILHSRSAYKFHFETPDNAPRPILRLEKAAIGYDGKPWLSNVNLTIHAGDRIGLLGQNGAGKSTLLKHLAGSLPILSGESWFSSNTIIGFFAQHQLEQLNSEQSPIDILLEHFKQLTTQQAQDYLGRYGFFGERVTEPVNNFSGGEKARLVLALIIKTKPNLLILDEPTNHLDLEMRESLTLALQEYSGALVLISHDRHLLRATCENFILIADNQVTPFNGDIEDYRQWLQSKTSLNKQKSLVENLNSNKSENRKEQRKKEAENRQKSAPLRKKIKSLEVAIDKHQKTLSELEEKLLDNSIYENTNREELKNILVQQGETKAQLESAELDWLELCDEMESS
ncbi:MAG: ATP-binding cassette domain-containing protein [Gammaproteobacteria bacterium]|nr:ATP-binding cassette domain-containing protein [Gammaproteobacteria bacterium]